MNHRYDFVYLFDCKDGNPNGDPDAANAPRVDPQDMRGLVSDVCLKRKIRNYVQIAKPSVPGFEIFVQQGSILNEKIKSAHESLGHRAKIGSDQVRDARQEMCRRYFDVRTFGAVMTTGANAGQVRGPVQITFSRSIDPVLPLDLSITRMAATEAKEGREFNQTMGRKALIPYGLYRCFGFISAHFARQTGFSESDLLLFWEALGAMFDHDRSASKGTLAAQKLVVFKHESALGNAPAQKLFDRISISHAPSLIQSGGAPRTYADYFVSIDRESLPAGIELIELI